MGEIKAKEIFETENVRIYIKMNKKLVRYNDNDVRQEFEMTDNYFPGIVGQCFK